MAHARRLREEEVEDEGDDGADDGRPDDGEGHGLGHRAGRIWGGLEAEVERGGPIGQWELEQDAARARIAAIAGAEFEPGIAAGRSQSLDEVIGVALGDT